MPKRRVSPLSEPYRVPVEQRREIRAVVERGFFDGLRLMADRYEGLKLQMRRETERFQSFSSESTTSPEEAERYRQAGEQAIESLRQSLQDLPRAVMQYVTQNQEIYATIQRAGGFMAWAQQFDATFVHEAALPTLFRLLERGLMELRNERQG